MQDIKKIVNYYKRKYNTSDPFELADRLNILYQFGDLKYEGCYMFLKITDTFFEPEPVISRQATGNGSRARTRNPAQKGKLLFYTK